MVQRPEVPTLPIDTLLPEIAAQVLAHPCLVIEAAPGAGKTTRVPPRLLELWPDGDVVVLEPRRLAAHLSAARVAEERGEALGGTVGVQLRFDSICGEKTRLRYVTEGVLLRQLLSNPTLRGVQAVVLDEFHERHLQADLALALLRRLQRGARPDLRIVVMSATLASAQVAAFLDDCPVVRSQGRSFEVGVTHQAQPSAEPLGKQVRQALRELIVSEAGLPAKSGSHGDILVFLPGGAEIRRCQEDLAELAAQLDLAVLPLHGDLPLTEQRRAVAPRQPGERRKVILSTNVAETSVTIDGVTAVIDSGLARIAGHAHWSGLPTLRVQPICRAAAAQRAGRAGRTQPGRCIRLYTRHDHDSRPEFELPEIRRIDLAELLLTLHAIELPLAELAFLDAPLPASVDAAEQLLIRLGALVPVALSVPAAAAGDAAAPNKTGGTAGGGAKITELGQRLAQLPVHPRLGRLLCAGHELGVGEDAAAAAALLSERDIRLGQRSLSGGQRQAEVFGPSDVTHLLELLALAQAGRLSRAALGREGLDPDAVQTVERARQKLVRLPKGTAGPRLREPRLREQALQKALLAAYPDRVARRRPRPAGETPEFVLAAGGSAVLSPSSVVREVELAVLIDVEDRTAAGGRGGRVVVRTASAIEADWLIELPGDCVHETAEPQWNSDAERIELVRRLQYEQLVLDESRTAGDGGDAAQVELLVSKLNAAQLMIFSDGEVYPQWAAKLGFVAQHCPEVGIRPINPAELDQVLRRLATGRASFAELRHESLVNAVAAHLEAALRAEGKPLSAPATQLVARLAPDHLTLPSGRRTRIHYPAGQPPWLESRLQDFFGMAQGPTVAGGRVPVVLHLLAPNQRAVQVTTDLPGFWVRHYPAIRKELARRYPKHAWPLSPATE